MAKERSGDGYTGIKLFPDSKEVIYDTPIASLPKEQQEIYLKGGYHSLVGRIISSLDYIRDLSAEQGAFLRNRLARELLSCTLNAHKDKSAAKLLIDYFDHKAETGLYSDLSSQARQLAESYIYVEASDCNLDEKPSL